MDIAGVEHSDDDDRSDVVNDGRRGEEDAQVDRDAGAHHGDQGNRERSVGRHRNAPPVRPRTRRDDQRIQKRRHDHAAERSRDRKRGGAAACEVADCHLALHFQSHDEEEHRQQAVVDPMEDGHSKGRVAQAHAELTPSQTVGPYFAYGLTPGGKYEWNDAFSNDLVTAKVSGDRIRVTGQVFDGDGAVVPDAMLEIWQADAQGRFADPQDQRALFVKWSACHRHCRRSRRGFPSGNSVVKPTNSCCLL